MRYIKKLLRITNELRQIYNRPFTLDGNLVGDIGEVLVAEKYGLTLLNSNSHVHDAKDKAGRLIQIKSSFSNRSYFPTMHTPHFIICIRIFEDGSFEELFNGPGKVIYNDYIKARNLTNKNRYLYTLSGGFLKKLNDKVPFNRKINLV